MNVYYYDVKEYLGFAIKKIQLLRPKRFIYFLFLFKQETGLTYVIGTFKPLYATEIHKNTISKGILKK